MSIAFSDTVNNTGILQQARFLARVDSTQWPTYKVVNSCNNWLDFLAGYAIGADRRFQWDDTNQSKLPEGTVTLTAAQTDYAFLTDEQGNSIITLTGVSVLTNGYYLPLTEVDRNDPNVDLSTFGTLTGTPTQYDKIADNVIRLDYKPSATVALGLKLFFERTPSYFAATDTTKSPGFSPLLHRGFVIASAYDAALTLVKENVQLLAAEREKEEQKAIQYFADRNQDTKRRMVPRELTSGDSNR